MQGFDDYLQIIQLKPKLVPNITDISNSKFRTILRHFSEQSKY